MDHSQSTDGHAPFPSVHFSAQQCRCGRWKESALHLVCQRCWFETPLAIRQLVHGGSPKDRRVAVRTILEAASARRVMGELKAELYQS